MENFVYTVFGVLVIWIVVSSFNILRLVYKLNDYTKLIDTLSERISNLEKEVKDVRKQVIEAKDIT